MQDPRPRLGAHLNGSGVSFTVRSRSATRMWVSVFDAADRETIRLELPRVETDMFTLDVPELGAGTRYGLRADGLYDPAAGYWFDPSKLLVDPLAIEIDRPYAYDPRLAAPRNDGIDTAPLMPKAIVTRLPESVPHRPPVFEPGGLIYEANVRALTMRHPDLPQALRGTIAALAHPEVVGHLKKLGVAAVEFMPVVAWIDERHLPPLGLRNAWGYNPVTFKPLHPRLAPGGIAELRATVDALHAAGIGVILDLVFNHTGESDEKGPTLSLRGLDAESYFAHRRGSPGTLVNDTGTGNTIDCQGPAMELVLDALRHFVLNAGVDGFRFDLATVLGRGQDGFSANAPLLEAIAADPVLGDRLLIAEPWDIGPGGYRLGGFAAPFLEWNDRYRDDVRRFWRGDRGTVGALATRLAGSSDVFRNGGAGLTRTVNFIAAHDGFTLADLVAFERKHNRANGEGNRDGHDENFSWNNGVEGETDDLPVLDGRRADARALLATLFASRGTIMLGAGDEFGRTQHGNNNAYAQDNDMTWLDWDRRDRALEDFTAALSLLRKRHRLHGDGRFLDGRASEAGAPADVEWLTESGTPMQEWEWNAPDRHCLVMMLGGHAGTGRVAVLINGDRRAVSFSVPARSGFSWRPATCFRRSIHGDAENGTLLVAARSVIYLAEEAPEE